VRQTLIGIDVGTTAVKAVLVDLDGNRLAEFACPHPMHRPTDGAAEQDPAAWMAAILDALAQFAAGNDLRGLAGIGICSQVNTHVFVDADGVPVRPAITWQDGRAAPDAQAIDARVSMQQKLDWFGGPVPSMPATPCRALPSSPAQSPRLSRAPVTYCCPRTIASCN